MAQSNQHGDQRRAGMNPRDQSLDRGFGGLPGKDAGVTIDDDTVTKAAVKNKVCATDQRREETKH